MIFPGCLGQIHAPSRLSLNICNNIAALRVKHNVIFQFFLCCPVRMQRQIFRCREVIHFRSARCVPSVKDITALRTLRQNNYLARLSYDIRNLRTAVRLELDDISLRRFLFPGSIERHVFRRGIDIHFRSACRIPSPEHIAVTNRAGKRYFLSCLRRDGSNRIPALGVKRDRISRFRHFLPLGSKCHITCRRDRRNQRSLLVCPSKKDITVSLRHRKRNYCAILRRDVLYGVPAVRIKRDCIDLLDICFPDRFHGHVLCKIQCHGRFRSVRCFYIHPPAKRIAAAYRNRKLQRQSGFFRNRVKRISAVRIQCYGIKHFGGSIILDRYRIFFRHLKHCDRLFRHRFFRNIRNNRCFRHLRHICNIRYF